ncbi:MAG: transcription termination/antitermination protein NusG [Pirellula staleyi]
MPILHEEISVYPDSLLEQNPSMEFQHWYLVYTRARHEKSLARRLHSHAMSFYLPLVAKEQFLRGRKVRSYLPVFSGYLFYFGDQPDELRKLAPSCVSRVLPVENETQLESELRGIQLLLSVGTPLTIESSLAPGQRVRIKSGALSGLEGTILKRKNGVRLLVAVNYLQQGVSIEIDDFMVETI